MGPEQLNRLVNEHAAALVLYARQWCAAPEDVVQEAFIKLAARRPSPDNLVGWLYRVVRNGGGAVTKRPRPCVRRTGSPPRKPPGSTARSPPRRCKLCPSKSAKRSS